MEIKSEILNDDSMKFVKESLIRASKNDHKENFRVKTVEYINDSSNNHSDMFFYDMLEYLRFYSLEDGGNYIAYTTPDHLIYMVCPTAKGGPGEKVRVWEFIYCHECMHQLWETFEVADRIKKNGIEYDHMLLNIASDCIINEYLKNVRKKEPFDNGWFPEVLEEEFGVKYDSKKDSQYSLYLKLLEIKKKNQEAYKDLLDKFKEFMGDDDNNQSGGESGDGESSDGGSDEGKSRKENKSSKGSQSSSNKDKNNSNEGSNSDIDDMTGEEAAEDAQKSADKLKKKATETSQKELADKYTDLADKAQQKANEAKKEAKNGNDDKAKKLAKEARDLVKQANEESSKKSGGNKPGKGTGPRIETDEELEKIRKNAAEKIKEYQKKLSGDLSTFLNKCESSQKLQKEGIVVKTNYGHSGWDEQMNGYVLSTVKQRIFQKKRQYQSTYSRIKRGSGYVKFGVPIEPGKKIKEDKLDIGLAYYIDKSGSMGNSIDNAFKACYEISDTIKKIFGRDPFIDKTEFKMFTFDEDIKELKWGKKCNASGGTADFDEILDYIIKNTKECLINVIITDAQFNVKAQEIKNLIKNLDGIIIFITNTPNDDMKEESKKYKTQLFYIEADTNFTLNGKK